VKSALPTRKLMPTQYGTDLVRVRVRVRVSVS